jgi:hypothetical protein
MSLYRCAECGHGRNLYAYSQAVAYGPVAADGLLASHDHTDDCFLFVNSIQCRVHPDGQIQTKVGTRFHIWRRCPQCNGESYEERRQQGIYGPCGTCGWAGGTWELPETATSHG